MNGKSFFRLLLRWIIAAGAVCFAAWVLPGIEVADFGTALLVALVLGLLNALVKPILHFLSMPLIILTLGLFLLVINAVLLYFVGDIVPGFQVKGLWPALWGSLIISIFTSLFSGKSKVRVKTNGNNNTGVQ
jgi:putative membrane protein